VSELTNSRLKGRLGQGEVICPSD